MVLACRCPLGPWCFCYSRQQCKCRYRNPQRWCFSGDRGQGFLLSPLWLSSWFEICPWDGARCAQLSLWQEALVSNLSTASYDKEAPPVHICHTDSQEARHMFLGHTCNSHHFQNKHKELACLPVWREPMNLPTLPAQWVCRWGICCPSSAETNNREGVTVS